MPVTQAPLFHPDDTPTPAGRNPPAAASGGVSLVASPASAGDSDHGVGLRLQLRLILAFRTLPGIPALAAYQLAYAWAAVSPESGGRSRLLKFKFPVPALQVALDETRRRAAHASTQDLKLAGFAAGSPSRGAGPPPGFHVPVLLG